MSRQTATTAKPLSPAKRKAFVDSLVAKGKLTARQAALIRFDAKPPEALREEARKLVPRARRVLARAATGRKAA